MAELTLVINAGGKSRRMGGASKALLAVPPDDTPLIVHLIRRLKSLPLRNAIVVANDNATAKTIEKYRSEFPELVLDIVFDKWPDSGAIGGVATGLTYCLDWAIVLACDLPFVNPVLLSRLYGYAREMDANGDRQWDLVVPRAYGFPQMMHTFYHVAALPTLLQQIERDNLKLLDVLPKCSVRYVDAQEMKPVDPDLRSLINVNTPDDWASALALMKNRHS